MALDTDFTSATYNSYVSVAEADVLIAALGPFFTTDKWDALDSLEKEAVILQATRGLNSFAFQGALNQLVISPFNMQWPRSGVHFCNGIEIPSDQIPPFVGEYIAMRSLEILDFGPQQANNTTVPSRVKSDKVGSLREEYFSPSEMLANTLSLRDFSSFNIIECYVVPRSGMLINLLRA